MSDFLGQDQIWRIKKGAALPADLSLVEDKRAGHKGHYMIAPTRTMPLKKYLGLLEELGLDRTRVELLTGFAAGQSNVG